MVSAIAQFSAEVTDTYGEFVVEPLVRGFGQTLGTPLRRILLSSIPGTAVTSVYIEDVLHEFSTIEGIKEDVMQIILNLKELVVKLHDSEPVTLTLRAESAGEVTAKDFDNIPNVEIVNPELHIATLTGNGKLVMEVRVEPGIGYVPAEVHNTKDRINSIPVNAIYTPVKRVAYRVEDTRVGQKTDLDRLVLEVWTDGSVSPGEALNTAVEIMREQLTVFGAEIPVAAGSESGDEVGLLESSEASEKPVEHISLDGLNLSSRVLHSLQEEGIDSVNALLALSRNDLKKVGGVGEKSLREIEETLNSQGYHLKE